MLKLELVRTGKFGDVEITEKDLEELVQNFQGEVPITLGHTLADYMPAVGWVKRIEKKDGSLIGEVELNDLVKEAFEQGLYKKWSVGIRKQQDGKKYLHHVALLGAVPPKIKDLKILKEVNLSDCSEFWTFNFADAEELADKPPPLESLDVVDTEWDVEAARKRVYEKYGIAGLKAYSLYQDPEADPETKSAYKFLVVDIVDGKPVIVKKAISAALAYLHGARGVKIPEEVRKKVEPKVEKLKKKIEEEEKMADEVLKEKDETIKKLKEELITIKKEALRSAISGKVPKALHDKVLLLADYLPYEEKIELSDEPNGKETRKLSAIDLLIEIFKSIPLPVRPGEMDLGDVDRAEEDIDGMKLLSKV
jgi:hypothetical protein